VICGLFAAPWPCFLLLRRKNTKAAIATAATPNPAPRPAASPVLLECDEVATDDDDEAACPAAVPVALPSALLEPLVPVVVADVDIEEITEVVAAVDAPVLELVFTNPDVEKVLVDDCIPGHDVLPMTVTVVGCDAPSLTVSFPDSQSQLASPGQQYQSSPSEVVHLANGIDVLLFSAKHHPGHCWESHVLSVQVPL